MNFERQKRDINKEIADIEDKGAVSEGGLIVPKSYLTESDGATGKKEFSISEVKEAIDFIYKKAYLLRKVEEVNKKSIGVPFPIYDSPLSTENSILNERIGYDGIFKEVLGGHTIKEYLKKQYGNKFLNIAEFGGPFRQASQDLAKVGVNMNASLGVTLLDHRIEDEVWNDTANDHTVLQANMFSLSDNPAYGKKYGIESLEKVEDWVSEKGKLDLIVSKIGISMADFNPITEREKEVYGSVQEEYTEHFINRPDAELLRTIFLKAVLRWYEFLSEEGTMLIECPSDTAEIIENMAKKIVTKDGGPALEVKTSTYKNERTATGVIWASTELRLKRLPGSPESIKLKDVLDSKEDK